MKLHGIRPVLWVVGCGSPGSQSARQVWAGPSHFLFSYNCSGLLRSSQAGGLVPRLWKGLWVRSVGRRWDRAVCGVGAWFVDREGRVRVTISLSLFFWECLWAAAGNLQLGKSSFCGSGCWLLGFGRSLWGPREMVDSPPSSWWAKQNTGRDVWVFFYVQYISIWEMRGWHVLQVRFTRFSGQENLSIQSNQSLKGEIFCERLVIVESYVHTVTK